MMLVLTRDDGRARTMAERTLRETEGCSHIEVWAGRRHLFTIEAPQSVVIQGADRGAPDSAPRSRRNSRPSRVKRAGGLRAVT